MISERGAAEKFEYHKTEAARALLASISFPSRRAQPNRLIFQLINLADAISLIARQAH
jgi:hypothetical protein